jgi:thioredoxin 1
LQEWSRDEIHEALTTSERSLLYLYTPLCGTCQVAGKMLTVISEMMPNQSIGKSDINYIPDLAEEWAIESVPCLLIFTKGKLEEKIYAFHSVPFLFEKINSLN